MPAKKSIPQNAKLKIKAAPNQAKNSRSTYRPLAALPRLGLPAPSEGVSVLGGAACATVAAALVRTPAPSTSLPRHPAPAKMTT